MGFTDLKGAYFNGSSVGDAEYISTGVIKFVYVVSGSGPFLGILGRDTRVYQTREISIENGKIIDIQTKEGDTSNDDDKEI